jgi:hypothetical protein
MALLTLARVCGDLMLAGASAIALSLIFIIGNVLKMLPYSGRFLPKIFASITNTDLPSEMYLESLLGVEMMKALWRMSCLNIKAKLEEGKSFPDASLVDTANRQR